MSLSGPSFPSRPLRRRPEQSPPEGSVRVQVWFAGDKALNLPQVSGQVAPHRGIRFILVGLGQRQEARHRQQTRSGQRKRIVLNPQAVRGGQRPVSDQRGQPFAVSVRIVHPVESGLVGIDLEPVGLCRRIHLHCARGCADQVRRDRSPVGCHGQRNRPDLLLVVSGVLTQYRVEDETLLSDFQRQTAIGVGRRHIQHRVARLAGPAAHDGIHRLPRGFLQRRPQVRRPRVLVGMPSQIHVQAGTKHAGREEVLKHPQHRSALAVTDRVKQLADLGRVCHFLFDRVRVLQAVEAERAVSVHVHELRPHRPFGEQPVHRLGAYPRGETLVEPQVVPPVHGHQVAEPHVRHLVCDHLGYSLSRARR